MRFRIALAAAVFVAGSVHDSRAQAITEFTIPAGGALNIAPGPDGNLWFTEASPLSPRIGRIRPFGQATDFPLTGSAFPAIDVTSGPDGNVWFTVSDTAQGSFAAIGRITPSGVVTLFPLPNPASSPSSITLGPDGALWFTEIIANRIGRMTTSGVIIEYPIPSSGSPGGIAAGRDGNLWFTETLANKIGRLTPAGAFTEFSIPTSDSRPTGITSGPDGNLWFTEFAADRIGRISTSGTIAEFLLPATASGATEIAAGPDGNVWFTARTANAIGRITPAGVVTEFPLPTDESDPLGITTGPDDAIWFTELAAFRIGRITTGIVADEVQTLPVVGSTAGVGPSFFRTSVQLHNSGTTSSAGSIRFHPSGVAGSSQDPTLAFTLAPGETQTIPDLLPAMGLSGLGSADVFSTVGSAGNLPVVSARVFNDAGAAGTTGFAFNALRARDALQAGQRGVVFVPSDLTNFRLNLGVRTLDADVLLTLTVRNASGAIAAVVPKFYRAVYHEQQAATAFLNGLALPAGGSITVRVDAGRAIFYGAVVDNRTGDPSLQIATVVP
ncbi:MAG TPA: hypothetical protein VIY96_01035 [Thermoanaerobaculia bacterium]